MRRHLAPSDVLRRDPAAQAIALPDGRLLVRHAGGASLLGGIRAEDLGRVLEEVDGARTAAEVAAACTERDPALPAETVLRLLAVLEGEMVHGGGRRQAPPLPRTEGIPVLAVGGGPLARRIARALRDMDGVEVRRLGRRGFAAAGLEGIALVVCALERTAYREVLAVQAACLAAGVPALFVTADPDGLRVGPTAVPGVGPCFACAQLAAFRFLRLAPATALAAVADLRAGAADAAGPARAAAAAAAEARELLRPGGDPSG